MSIWENDPFMAAGERLAKADPEAFATFVRMLLNYAESLPSDSKYGAGEHAVILGRVEGSLLAASTSFIPKESR